uniref:Uncharacterized protein n=1 Tax=Pyxicephalus adspersus TaxID=30357 RepID=A0AAV3A8W8_PYXAD|nr:TPA: hypothetical protein GDO54_015445 [Pyxicephalus adspersus]
MLQVTKLRNDWVPDPKNGLFFFFHPNFRHLIVCMNVTNTAGTHKCRNMFDDETVRCANGVQMYKKKRIVLYCILKKKMN